MGDWSRPSLDFESGSNFNETDAVYYNDTKFANESNSRFQTITPENLDFQGVSDNGDNQPSTSYDTSHGL